MVNSVAYLSRVFGKEGASKLEEGLQHGGVLPQACEDDSRVQCKGLHICSLSPSGNSQTVMQMHFCCDCEDARSPIRLGMFIAGVKANAKQH